MSLVIFNGSPRGVKSNSTLLIEQFINGMKKEREISPEIHYLAKVKHMEYYANCFLKAETVIIIFPLYTDAMPGQVKTFIDKIYDQDNTGKKVGFIVQSGFPESFQSTFVERYLQNLSYKKGWSYLGCVIKGNVEGIQVMPAWATRKLYRSFEQLGSHFAKHSQFDSVIVNKLRKPLHYNKIAKLNFHVGKKLGFIDMYWNMKMKENNCRDKCFNQPYLIPSCKE